MGKVTFVGLGRLSNPTADRTTVGGVHATFDSRGRASFGDGHIKMERRKAVACLMTKLHQAYLHLPENYPSPTLNPLITGIPSKVQANDSK